MPTASHKLLATSAVGLFALVTAAQAQDATVTIAAYSGIFQDNYETAVIEPFMAANPDIEVSYYPMSNSAEMLGTLRAQKGSPQVDVVIMDVSVAKAATDEGLYAPLDRDSVPNIADVYPEGLVEGVNGAAVTFDNLVLLYNTGEIETPPTSWRALWDEAYDGMVVIPAAPDIQGTSLTVIANRMAGGPPYTESVEPGIALLGELAPRVQTWAPTPDPYLPIMNGSATVGIGWNARAQNYADQSEGSMGVALPEEGSVFQINTISVVEGSANAEAARRFMDYTLSPQAQKAFTETMFYAPSNQKAADIISPEALDRTAATPERRERMIPIDWLEIAKIRNDITEQWRRQIIAKSR